MNKGTLKQALDVRYSELAEQSCCLSCGDAVGYAAVKPGEVCVDLGSGRGQDVLKMAEAAGRGGMAYGIDISAGMLKHARETAAEREIVNAVFMESELESLPLASASVDVVISNCTINHARDKRQVYREIARILRPAGRIVISDIYALDEIPPEYAADPAAVAECWAGAVLRDEYFEILAGAGFKTLTIYKESEPYTKGKARVVSITFMAEKESKEVSYENFG